MKLSSNFGIIKYGLKVSLVTEDDAAFIVSLRADHDRTKYMLTLDANIEQQRRWIREYKKREEQGLDYYFIYRNSSGEPIGVNRVSKINLKNSNCKVCSWIKRRGPETEALAMFVIRMEIIFDILNLNSFYCDFHKNNKNALKYWSNLKLLLLKEEADFYYYSMNKEAWGFAQNWYSPMLNP